MCKSGCSPAGGLTLPNRLVVAPMCQYASTDVLANDWHLTHWAQLLNGGAGMLTIEATAVSPEGRITPACLGLWDARTERALADAKRAGLLPARLVKLRDRDKTSWIVHAGGGMFKTPAELAKYLGQPRLTGAVPKVTYLQEQEDFFGEYAGRFGHYTSIEEAKG